MIYDAENTFFWNVKLSGQSGTGEIIKTGKGDAGSPLTLVVKLPGASADCTVTLETADNDKMTGAKTLAVKVPYGDLGYLRLKWASAAAQSAGTISASLVMDADVR